MADAVRLKIDATEPDPGSSARPGRPISRLALRPVAPLSGTAALPHEEIRLLLRQRLIVVALAVAPVYALIVGVQLSGIDPSFSLANLGWGVVGLTVLVALGTVGCLIWLLGRPRMNTTALRCVEFGIFGMLAASLSSARYAVFASGPVAEFGGAAHGRYYLQWIAALNGIGWMGCIIGYGVLIPNGRRRAAAMVLSLAAVPLITDVLMVLGHPRAAAYLPYLEVVTSFALIPSVPIALFGSFRITALAGEAAAARREARALNQYSLKRRLGVGGMGEVYLAEHHLLKRPCALKLIRPDQANDAKAVQRFQREVQATAKLTHLNIVEVYDYGQTEDGTFYYVMEYLPGIGLDELVMRDGALPPARAVHLIRQLCGALREAHGVRLVHRDVKPSNVLVCPYAGMYDVAKLLDFGLVHLVTGDTTEGALTRPGGVVGTPDYMSPEQARGLPLDARSDLYSLGAVAYFLLTGRPPFVCQNITDILFAHCHDTPTPPSSRRHDLPADLDAVVLRCLAKNPDDRFQTAEALDTALACCAVAGAWTQEQASACCRTIPLISEPDDPTGWERTATFDPSDAETVTFDGHPGSRAS